MCRRFIANAQFETSGTPVHELNSTLRLDDRDGSINVLGNNITTI
jgi:hypothetical protein